MPNKLGDMPTSPSITNSWKQSTNNYSLSPGLLTQPLQVLTAACDSSVLEPSLAAAHSSLAAAYTSLAAARPSHTAAPRATIQRSQAAGQRSSRRLQKGPASVPAGPHRPYHCAPALPAHG